MLNFQKNIVKKINTHCYISYNPNNGHTAIVVLNYDSYRNINNVVNIHELYLKGFHDELFNLTMFEAIEYYSRSQDKILNFGSNLRKLLLNLSFFNDDYKQVGII